LKLDWMPLDIPAYLADTGHLSTLEHGIYFLLIMHYWRAGGLPDDEKQLARIARVTLTEFRGARPTIEPLFKLGNWKHKRIEFELEKARKISAKRSLAAEEKHALAPAPDPASADANAPAKAHANGVTLTLNTSPSPSKKDSSFGDVKREGRSPPRHGITSQKHGRIYVVKGSSEWDSYADDYRAARGEEPRANEHGGRWFKILGEAAE
jgi:uncharacterized protein YdaU (DUF1376 family)